MNPTQFYISVAVMPVTTIIIVLIGVLWSNTNTSNRLSDLSAAMNNRFNDMNNRFNDMNNRFNDLHRWIDEVKESLRAEIAKNHSEMLERFADLDRRLSRIETQMNLK